MTELSGLSKEIREATESEQFDLGGYDQQQIDKLVKESFTDPLEVVRGAA